MKMMEKLIESKLKIYKSLVETMIGKLIEQLLPEQKSRILVKNLQIRKLLLGCQATKRLTMKISILLLISQIIKMKF
jgi:hypothetical protein